VYNNHHQSLTQVKFYQVSFLKKGQLHGGKNVHNEICVLLQCGSLTETFFSFMDMVTKYKEKFIKNLRCSNIHTNLNQN